MSNKKKKFKGFEFKDFVSPVSDVPISYVLYGGNFFMELHLPNALKLNSFEKLRNRLDLYIKSHGEHLPAQITINKRQYNEYGELFSKGRGRPFSHVPSYNGIPMIVRHG